MFKNEEGIKNFVEFFISKMIDLDNNIFFLENFWNILLVEVFGLFGIIFGEDVIIFKL